LHKPVVYYSQAYTESFL